MAITPAERRGYDERVRQTREEYENRETDANKRRSEEIKRLEKRHREEVARLNEDYQNQIDSLQSNNRETLTERDQKHRNEVAEIKGLYMDQLRRKMEDNASQRRALEETYEAQLEKQKETSTGQRAHLSERQSEELAKRDEKLNEAIRSARAKTAEGIEDNRNRLTAAHQKEKEILRKDRDESLLRKDFERNELSKSLNGEIKRVERSKDEAVSHWHQKYYDTVENMKSEHSESMQSQKELLDQEVLNQRQKYQNKLEEKSAQMDINNDDFRDSVVGRQNAQIRSRESKIQTLQNKLNNQITNDQRMRNKERDNLAQAYEARFRDLARQKDESVDVMKELNAQRINNVTARNDQVLRAASQDFRSEVNLMNLKNREDRKGLEEQHRDQIRQAGQTADKRIRKMEKLTTQNVRDLASYYDENLNTLKVDYAEKVDAQRDNHVSEQNRLTNVMTNRFRDMESRFQQRMEQTVDKYEDQIARMKEDSAKEKKRLEEAYQSRLKDLEKGHRLEKDSMEQKYETKLAMSNEKHAEEINKVNRRHEEDIRVAVNRANSYSRKA